MHWTLNYVHADLLATAQTPHQIDVIGPPFGSYSRQWREGKGYDLQAFIHRAWHVDLCSVLTDCACKWVGKPQIKDSDLIFVLGRGHAYDWQVAPIFYCLNAGRYHYVGRDFARAIQNHPHSRVWVLSFPSIPTEKEAVDALAGYQVRKRVDARGIFAQLYVGKAPGNTVSGDQ
jgi:hypothetical protein